MAAPEVNEDTEEQEGSPGRPFQMTTLARHSLIYGGGMLATKLVAVLMLPIYTNWLTTEDYGVLQLITMTFEVVTLIAGSRLGLGLFHFYYKEDDSERRKEIVSTAFLLLSFTYGVTAIATAYFAPSLAAFVFDGEAGVNTLYIRLAALSMAFEGMIIVPYGYLRLTDRSVMFVGVSLGRLALHVSLNLLFLVGFDMGVLGVLLGSAISNTLIGFLLSFSLLRSVGKAFRRATAVAFVRFGIPLVVMQGATFITTFGDRFFLNRATNESTVGVYGMAYLFGILVAQLGYAPFQQGWGPRRFELAKDENRDEIYAKVFVYLNILLMTAAVGLSLFAGDALRLIANEDFHVAAEFVPVLALAIVFQSWSSHLNLGTFIREKPEYYTLAKWGAAFVALAGYLLLIPLWGVWGAVITTLVSLVVDAFLSHTFSQRLWRVEYRWAPVVAIVTLGVAVGGGSMLIPALPLLTSIGVHLLMFSGYLVALWVLPVLSAEERSEARRRAVDGLARAQAVVRGGG